MPRGKNRKKREALTYHSNFWSKKRVENNMTAKDIGELLEIKDKTANAYFTGQCIPHEEQIKVLCDYFGVDLVEGTREFINAHKKYDAIHNRKLVLSHKTKKEIEKATKEESAFNDEPTPVEEVAREVAEKISEQTDRLMEAVYKKLEYDDYKALMGLLVTHENADVERWLYDKVDFETFKKIEKILGG